MKIEHSLLLAAALACSAAIQAQTCSGSADVTGNECSTEVAPASDVDARVWQRLSERRAGRMPAGVVAAQPDATRAGGASATDAGGQSVPVNATILLLPAGTAIMLPAGASLTTVDVPR